MNKKRGIDREGRGGENNTKLTLHCRGERRELMHVCWEYSIFIIKTYPCGSYPCNESG